MNDETQQTAEAADDEARHRPLEDDLRGLIESGVTLAKAEVALQQARAVYAVGRIKTIALLGLLALMLVFFSLVALTVGMVIALTPLIGAIWATLAVFGGLVLVAGLAALAAAGQWKKMTLALSNPGGE